jgi:hypothetical protein
LSIVIPAYNEADRLIDEAARLHQAVVRGAIDPSSTELIVVDDGSSDDTAERSQELFGRSFSEFHLLRRKVNSGKGAAIRDGIAAARAPVVAFMDADMAVDPEQLPLLVAAIDDAEIAIGSRSVPGSTVECDSFRRALMGKSFNRLVNMLTDVGVGDTQCGFKAFRTPVARLLFHCMAIERFAFDVELLHVARRLRLRVAEVPVHWRDVDGSAVRPIMDPLSMTLDVLRLRMGRRSHVVPASSVTSNAGGCQRSSSLASLLLPAFGTTLPVLDLEPDHAVVLFPLCSLDDVPRAISEIGQLVPESTVRNYSMSVSQLERMAAMQTYFGGTVEMKFPAELRSGEMGLSSDAAVANDAAPDCSADQEPTSISGI